MPQEIQRPSEPRVKALKDALDPRLEIPMQARLELLETYRGRPSDRETRDMDELLLKNSVVMAKELLRARADLRARIDLLTSPPHFPAVYLGQAGERKARVAVGGGERVVFADGDVAPAPGEMVLLNGDRTVIVGKCQRDAVLGDVANFMQKAGGGRVVVNHRGESRVCQPVNGLKPDALRKGDLVLIDAANNLAIERVQEPAGERLPFEVEDPSGASVADVGGLDAELDQLLWTLLIGVEHSETARRMRIGGFTSVLLHGPPGTGKTLMARVAAGELQRRTGTRTRFLSVRPSEWRSEWVGATERAIRETFSAIRRLAADGGHVVLFLDEADSLGRVRGSVRGAPVLDDFTNALLAELDGFSSLKNIAVISASNRKDMLDPALRERLGSVDIHVPRPRMAAARSIFRVHLREDDPWAGEFVRDEAVETALSLIYAPAGDSNEITRIRFNDGSSRVVKAAELCSGRIIQQISANARRSAARREIDGGLSGIALEDVTSATLEVIDGLRSTLSRENAASCLPDLPQDLAVTSVEPIRPANRRNKQPR
jgi:ATP-dependent 26S proteasome regulatory subunit